jgi:hypothetical protein
MDMHEKKHNQGGLNPGNTKGNDIVQRSQVYESHGDSDGGQNHQSPKDR